MEFYTKIDSYTWDTALPNVKVTEAGYKKAKAVWQKTGATTWTQKWGADIQPPGIPVTVTVTSNAYSRKITIAVKAPADADVRNLRIKVSPTAYPATPTTGDSAYTATKQADGAPWSDPKVVPSQTVSRVWPAGTGLATVGINYYISVWAEDASHNFSLVKQALHKIPKPTTAVPASATKSGYITATSSNSYSGLEKTWNTSNNYVYQGSSEDFRGLWFYGTKIATLLKNAKKINSMSIKIGRMNAQVFGYGGSGLFLGVEGYGPVSLQYALSAKANLRGHTWTTQQAGDPLNSMLYAKPMGTFSMGEYETLQIDPLWFNDILGGVIKGFGLQYGPTTTESEFNFHAYGAGTESGKLYVNWTE